MAGLFDGTPQERPVTCEVWEKPLAECRCPRNAAGEVLLSSQQTALIRLEKRRQGKVVTTIAGLDPAASDLPMILQQLKQRCGSGGTLAENTLEIQGDHRVAVGEVLHALGYGLKQI